MALCRADHSSRGVLPSVVCLSVIAKPSPKIGSKHHRKKIKNKKQKIIMLHLTQLNKPNQIQCLQFNMRSYIKYVTFMEFEMPLPISPGPSSGWNYNPNISCSLLHIYRLNPYTYRGPRWRSWLRHCATSQKVAGSIPDGVIILLAALWPWGRLSL